MYKNHQIVCCTAAGRRRYMQYIFPYIVSCPIVDRYDVWINTVNMEDIEFFRKMEERYPKINLVMQPDGIVNGISSINAFYKFCCEPETIYMKIDDDVVWMEPDIFEKMAEFRLVHHEAFLVSPMVINNALCSYVWQVQGKFEHGRYLSAQSNHPHVWKRGGFAAAFHEWFIGRMKSDSSSYTQLYVRDTPWAMNRFSINFIVWFGEQMAAFNGVVPGDDELFLSCIKPSELGQPNWLRGDALISHFSFGPQRALLDKVHILEKYGEILEREFAKESSKKECYDYEQTLVADIQKRAAEISSQPCPYKTVPKTAKQKIRQKFKKFQQSIRMWKERRSGLKFKLIPKI